MTHGFTTAFAVGVGVLVLAAIIVVTLIQSNKKPDAAEPVSDYDYPDAAGRSLPEAVPAG